MKKLAIALITLFTFSAAMAENYFKTALGKSDAEVQARVDSTWQHFFTPGNLKDYEKPWEKTVYYEAGPDMAFIMDTGSNDVRTEGMSYGMMIAVQLDKREVFDRLWRWAKTHMAYPADSPWDGYFCWQCRPDGTKIGRSNASDGELYFVTALYLASQRWHDSTYAAEADSILRKIMDKDGSAGVFPLFNEEKKLITFVPDRGGYYFTDPSYMLPAFLDYWVTRAPERRDFWKEAAEAARNHLVASSHPVTGLYPDYSNWDGTPFRWKHSSYNTAMYKYDALRCPMNVGMDYYLTGRDRERQRETMRRLLQFFVNDNFTSARFNLDGTGSEGNYNPGQAGANAVGAITLLDSPDESDRRLATTHLQRMWDTRPPQGKFRYYEGMVYFLSLLHLSGNFTLK